MKKFYFLFLFALIASIGNLYAVEKTVTWNFAGRKSGTGATTSCELKVQSGSASGTWKITASKKFSAQTGSGSTSVTLGSKNDPCTDAKLELTNSPIPEGAQIKKVSITANTNKAKGATFGLQIGGVSSETTLTFDKTKTTQEFTESKVGNVVLVINTLNQSNVSLYSLSITYEEVAETKCAKPTFNLENGKTYTDAQTLVITSTTADATIHYTINRGEEKTGQPAEFTENGEYTVDAWATKDNLTESDHASIKFTIAKKMNKPTFNLTEGAVYGEAKVLVITSDKEGAQIEYTIVGGRNISITKKKASPVNVTLDQNGEYTVEAFALEMGDYAKSDAAGLNFKIELAAGVPTFSVEEGTYSEAQTITLAPGEGGEKVFYTINDGTEQQYIEPIKLEEEGTYKIAAYTAATETLAKSATVTKTYVINLPLEEPYILCKNAAWLTEGTKIIFVGENLTNGETFGMASQGTNTYRGQGVVTLSEDGNFLNDKEAEVRVFSVERSGAKMAFKDVEGYLYTDNAKNSIKTKKTIADDCYWTVSIGTDNVASVVSSSLTKNTDYRNIKYNASSDRFAAYNDKYEGKVYIYLLGKTSSVSSMSAEGVKVFAAEGGVKVVADEATDVAVYTAAGQLVRQARVAEGSTLVNVAPGFYVVRANGTATKVIVR